MTESEYASRLDELEQLLNDPSVPIQPQRIWTLLDEIARHDRMQAHPVHG